MSTEYEDVLTNQPVVIDNVRIGLPYLPFTSFFVLIRFSLFFLRAREQSKLDSLARITQNVFSPHSAFQPPLWSRMTPPPPRFLTGFSISPASDGRTTLGARRGAVAAGTL